MMDAKSIGEDRVVEDLFRIVSELARLAATANDPEVVAQCRKAAVHVSRAAAHALPLGAVLARIGTRR